MADGRTWCVPPIGTGPEGTAALGDPWSPWAACSGDHRRPAATAGVSVSSGPRTIGCLCRVPQLVTTSSRRSTRRCTAPRSTTLRHPRRWTCWATSRGSEFWTPCADPAECHELARRGASVVGVDLSSALLGKAEAEERSAPLGVAYAVADITSADVLAGESFDAVVSSYGLGDIDDLAGALGTFARVLQVDGRLAFSILHPCFPGSLGASPSWPAAGYYREGWWRGRRPDRRSAVKLAATIGCCPRT